MTQELNLAIAEHLNSIKAFSRVILVSLEDQKANKNDNSNCDTQKHNYQQELQSRPWARKESWFGVIYMICNRKYTYMYTNSSYMSWQHIMTLLWYSGQIENRIIVVRQFIFVTAEKLEESIHKN